MNFPKTKLKNTPERYYNVSHSQLSIVRHYGSIVVNGWTYLYNQALDEAVREDVLAREAKERKVKAKKINACAATKQFEIEA